MAVNIFTRRRLLLGREVREPTLLAITLAALGYVLLLCACGVAIVALPVFGYLGWAFAAITAILVCVVIGMRPKRKPTVSGPTGDGPAAIAPTGRQRWLRRLSRGGRWLLAGVLVCWLGLIVWLAFGPGGSPPPPNADPSHIRVITWNIHCGQEDGLPWKRFDWPARKHALRAALHQAKPDILCVQEATPAQVAFLEDTLPGHRRIGIGRDGIGPNGENPGSEHCAIYFDRERFTELGSGTFWLEEPIDQPRSGGAFDVKRICTWVRLRDHASGRTLRVYNTHLYLTDPPRLPAAQLILSQMRAGDPADAVLLTADFNAGPADPSRRVFFDAGLADSAVKAGEPAGIPTFQLYGIGVWCIDGILVDPNWRVADFAVLRMKPGHIYPSDHFGLMADIVLPE